MCVGGRFYFFDYQLFAKNNELMMNFKISLIAHHSSLIAHHSSPIIYKMGTYEK